MDPEEHVRRIDEALAPHWDRSKPTPKDGPVADRQTLADFAPEYPEQMEELFALARDGSDEAVGAKVRELRKTWRVGA